MKTCDNCIYAGKVGKELACLYILYTGHRRPCPSGDSCTVKTTQKDRRKLMRKTWDESRALELIDAGFDDAAIATESCLIWRTLPVWMRKVGYRICGIWPVMPPS